MNPPHSPWRLSVAPMMDWTDRHCRFFHRLLTSHTRLYTEMVTTGALLRGDVPRSLAFNAEEHPLALQLGGSEPAELARCAKLAEIWGYDEVNLNCGCPSERVQRGAFGACLMAEPALVADCVKAIRDVTALPVTVKHRIGIDRHEDYNFVRDFVGTVAEAGCEVFIVHARNAWLKGISPRENRELPPLRYATVHQLKREFPALTIVLNGGIKTSAQIAEQLDHVDGVMLGREAYHNPWAMTEWDHLFFGADRPAPDRDEVESKMVAYMQRETVHRETVQRETVQRETGHRESGQHGVAAGPAWSQVSRHMLGLRNGLPGARRWRQAWSDHHLKGEAPATVSRLAREAVPTTADAVVA